MSAAVSTAEPTSIADQATDALTTPVSSAHVQKLRDALDVERDDLAEKLRETEDAAIDPLVKSDAARELREKANEIQFGLDRLDSLFTALTKRRDELRKAEAQSSKSNAYAAVKAERDALVVEIRERYPLLIAELIDIATRLKASNARVAQCNAAGVTAATWLYGAEGLARRREEISNTPSILTSMRLPAPLDGPWCAWPRSEVVGAAEVIDKMLAPARAKLVARAKAA